MPGPAPRHPSVRRRRNLARAEFRVLSSVGGAGTILPWPLQPDLSLVAEFEAQRDRIVSIEVEIPETEDRRHRGRLKRELNRRELAVRELELEIEHAREATRTAMRPGGLSAGARLRAGAMTG